VSLVRQCAVARKRAKLESVMNRLIYYQQIKVQLILLLRTGGYVVN
jgi:hypothetical protein